jgi:hypothetical protein
MTRFGFGVIERSGIKEERFAFTFFQFLNLSAKSLKSRAFLYNSLGQGTGEVVNTRRTQAATALGDSVGDCTWMDPSHSAVMGKEKTEAEEEALLAGAKVPAEPRECT